MSPPRSEIEELQEELRRLYDTRRALFFQIARLPHDSVQRDDLQNEVERINDLLVGLEARLQLLLHFRNVRASVLDPAAVGHAERNRGRRPFGDLTRDEQERERQRTGLPLVDYSTETEAPRIAIPANPTDAQLQQTLQKLRERGYSEVEILFLARDLEDLRRRGLLNTPLVFVRYLGGWMRLDIIRVLVPPKDSPLLIQLLLNYFWDYLLLTQMAARLNEELLRLIAMPCPGTRQLAVISWEEERAHVHALKEPLIKRIGEVQEYLKNNDAIRRKIANREVPSGAASRDPEKMERAAGEQLPYMVFLAARSELLYLCLRVAEIFVRNYRCLAGGVDLFGNRAEWPRELVLDEFKSQLKECGVDRVLRFSPTA